MRRFQGGGGGGVEGKSSQIRSEEWCQRVAKAF